MGMSSDSLATPQNSFLTSRTQKLSRTLTFYNSMCLIIPRKRFLLFLARYNFFVSDREPFFPKCKYFWYFAPRFRIWKLVNLYVSIFYWSNMSYFDKVSPSQSLKWPKLAKNLSFVPGLKKKLTGIPPITV